MMQIRKVFRLEEDGITLKEFSSYKEAYSFMIETIKKHTGSFIKEELEYEKEHGSTEYYYFFGRTFTNYTISPLTFCKMN